MIRMTQCDCHSERGEESFPNSLEIFRYAQHDRGALSSKNLILWSFRVQGGLSTHCIVVALYYQLDASLHSA